MFMNQPTAYDSDQEREYFWELFLRSFALRADDPNAVRRGTEADPGRYYRESGLHPSNIDWRAWRDLMGYPSKK
jgi:hypothetical protein